jgi:hypothetical protein
MDLHFMQSPSFSSLVHDALIVGGVGIALLAGLVFINLGVLLPGLLSLQGGHQGDPRGKYVEFGPAAAPLITDPVPCQASSRESHSDPQPLARPHLWHRVSGGGATQLAWPLDGGTR